MSNIRLIPRLDIKSPNLIKGIQLEGLRVIGNPKEYARRYYEEGADELIYMDVVASLYGRNSLGSLVEEVANDVFIPMTVGGGIRSIADVDSLLRCGADKVAVNTAAINDPMLIGQIASRFGSQCMVLSVEAKRQCDGSYEAYTDNGRERSGRDVVLWAREAVERGAGEILLTSVDREGTRQGFDIDLVQMVSDAVRVPVIASGGLGSTEDAVSVVKDGQADAVAVADAFHYGRLSIPTLRACLRKRDINVRDCV